ncbi:MAG: VWA domain-containing protein [Burkholderiaceae bacterium]
MLTNSQCVLARPASSALALAIASTLAACGGGGEGPSPSATPEPPAASTQLSATVVTPQSLGATSTKALRPASAAVRSVKDGVCPEVPDGYEPAASSSVELLNAEGAVEATATTDACGRFDVLASDKVSSVRISPAGHQPLVLESGQLDSGFVASALPTGARFEIAAVQRAGPRSLSALVVDSVTKKAVLGLSSSSVSVIQGGGSIPVLSVRADGNALNATPFSTVLVMDSSSSMGGCAANCVGDPGRDSSQPSYTGYQLVARAAHVFLDGKKPSDEVAISAFSSRVFWFDDARFDSAFRGAGGTVTNYTYAPDGFTLSADALRLPIDYYNRYSKFWRATGDDLHPVTQSKGLSTVGNYPLSGNTALFTAVDDAVKRVAVRGSTRRIVIALTDGENNSGSVKLDDAIATATAAGVPVYTIGFGIDPADTAGSAPAADLLALANRTGADASFVNGPAVVGLFAGLQTAIRFETTISLSQDLDAGLPASLIIAAPGQPTVSRDVLAVVTGN